MPDALERLCLRHMTKHLPQLRRFLAVSVAAGFLLASGVTAVPAQAEDAPPAGFPSWADVEQAKGNAAATAAEVTKISHLLDSLEADAGVLGTAAVKAGANYALTQQKLDVATAEVDVLKAQAQRAAEQAGKYKKDVVAVAVQSYKTGGTGLGIFTTISALESPESLNGIDMLHQVGEQAAIKYARANQSQASANALEKTRAGAQTAQQQLATAASDSRDVAVAAQTAVTDQLSAQKTHSTTLVSQLAALNNTTVATEQEFRQGQVALAAYEQAQTAKRQAAQAEAAKRQAAQDEAARRAAAEIENAAALKPVTTPGIPNPVPAPVRPNPAPNPGVAHPVPEPVLPPAPVDPNPDDGYIPVDVLLPNIPGGAVNDPAGAQAYASLRLGSFGWAQDQFQCLNQLWERESNWRTNATNPYSGAYGIAQALPPGKYSTAGPDWLTNYRTQIDWGLGYMKNRYGSPCGAWSHSQTVGWY